MVERRERQLIAVCGGLPRLGVLDRLRGRVSLAPELGSYFQLPHSSLYNDVSYVLGCQPCKDVRSSEEGGLPDHRHVELHNAESSRVRIQTCSHSFGLRVYQGLGPEVSRRVCWKARSVQIYRVNDVLALRTSDLCSPRRDSCPYSLISISLEFPARKR